MAVRVAGIVRVCLVIGTTITLLWTWSSIGPRLADLFAIMWYIALSNR